MQGQAYGLRCVRCGSPLEIPADPRFLHIDCPHCGQDNVLPAPMVEARRQQLAWAEQARIHQANLAARSAQEVARQKRSRNVILTIILLPIALFVAFLALGLWLNSQQKAESEQRKDVGIVGLKTESFN